MEIIETKLVKIDSSRNYFDACKFCNGQGHVPSGKITFVSNGENKTAYPGDNLIKYSDGSVDVMSGNTH